MYAVIGNKKACYDALRSHGAGVDFQDVSGLSVCHWAAAQEAHKMLKYIIEGGARWTLIDNTGRTALHWAALAESTKVVKAITTKIVVDERELVDHQDNDGMTALHWAAVHSKPKHISLLVRAEADSTLLDAEERAPLHWACDSEDATSAKVLLTLDNAPVNSKDRQGRTPLHIAVAQGSIQTVRELCQYPNIDKTAHDNVSRTPLHWAAAAAHTEIVKILSERGADLSHTDEHGASAMHYAAQNDRVDTLHALLTSNAEHLPDEEGRYPLHWAVMRGFQDHVGILLEHGIDVDLVDKEGRSSLHFAVSANLTETAELLLSVGANPNLADQQMQTPIFAACEAGDTAMVRLLVENEAKINIVDADERTPLHWVSVNGSMDTMNILLEAKAKVNEVDESGKTCLAYAAYQGHASMVRELVEREAEVDAQDIDGVCALHWAALQGFIEIVTLLIDAGARPNQMEINENKSTPLDYAIINGHQEVAEYLSGNGGLSVVDLQELAAITVQSSWKGFKVRANLLPKLLGEKMARDASPEQHKAASTIAALMRGHFTRKNLPELQKFFEEERAVAKERKELNSATVIQASWKGHRQRKAFLETEEGKAFARRARQRVGAKGRSMEEMMEDMGGNWSGDEALELEPTRPNTPKRPEPGLTLLDKYLMYKAEEKSRKTEDRQLFQAIKGPLGPLSTKEYRDPQSDPRIIAALTFSGKQRDLRLQEERNKNRTRQVIAAARTIQEAWRLFVRRRNEAEQGGRPFVKTAYKHAKQSGGKKIRPAAQARMDALVGRQGGVRNERSATRMATAHTPDMREMRPRQMRSTTSNLSRLEQIEQSKSQALSRMAMTRYTIRAQSGEMAARGRARRPPGGLSAGLSRSPSPTKSQKLPRIPSVAKGTYTTHQWNGAGSAQTVQLRRRRTSASALYDQSGRIQGGKRSSPSPRSGTAAQHSPHRYADPHGPHSSPKNNGRAISKEAMESLRIQRTIRAQAAANRARVAQWNDDIKYTPTSQALPPMVEPVPAKSRRLSSGSGRMSRQRQVPPI